MRIKSNLPHFRIEKQGMAKKILDVSVGNYYLIVMFLYLLSLKVNSLRVGVVSAAIMLLIAGLYCLKFGINIRASKIEVFVVAYFAVSFFSVINYIKGEASISVFLQTVSNSLLPIVFFWCGQKNIIFSKKSYLIAHDVCCMMGVYLLITRPHWYYIFCISRGYSYTRLSSCFGSTAVGMLSCIAIVFSLQLIQNSKAMVWKMQFLLSCLFALFSMQRSAWIVSFLAIIVFHYWLLKWHSISIRHIVLELFIVILALIVSKDYVMAVFTRWILEHQVSGGNVWRMFDRSTQWIEVMSQSNLLMGSGMGLRGHRAAVAGVADGDWIRLLCEIGIIGVFILLLIIYEAYKVRRYDLKQGLAPFMIILMLSLQMIGSNVLEFQIIAPAFWMSVGQTAYISINMRQRRQTGSHENISTISASIP